MKNRDDVRAGITVQKSRRLHRLLSILAPLAFERLVRLANRLFIEQEQLSQRVQGEMTLRVFLFVYDSRRKGLLGRLPLEDLFFDGAGGDEAVDEA